MHHLRLSLLGAPLVWVDGAPVAWRGGSRPLAMLAYLASEADRAHSREHLARLLWPDRREFRRTLHRHTGGNPLFTLELLREMEARGGLVTDEEGMLVDAHPDWGRLPARVEAVVAERIARLSAERQEILTAASVAGEEFGAELVAYVSGLPPEHVRSELSGPLSRQYQLVQAVRVDWLGGEQISQYRFAHHVFQTFLYQRQDPVERSRRHQLIGEALEEMHIKHPGELVALAPTLAWHYEAAGNGEKAAAYLLQAGREAQRLSAATEAAAFYRRGLALLDGVAPSSDRDILELDLLVGLENSILVSQGWGVPGSMEMLRRAHRLAEDLGRKETLLAVLHGMASISVGRAKHAQGVAYATELLSLARELNSFAYQAIGHRMIGTAEFFLGRLSEARTHLEAGIRCHQAIDGRAASSGMAGREGSIFLRVWLPHVLLMLGYPDRALLHNGEALKQAMTMRHAHPQIMALSIMGPAFFAAMRQPEETLAWAEKLLDMMGDENHGGYVGWATFFRGWALAQVDAVEKGLPQMLTGLDQLRRVGTRVSMVHLHVLLGETYGQIGAVEQGLSALAEAERLAVETDDHTYRSEICRAQGDLLVKVGNAAGVETLYLRAIEVARAQEAKLLELRATVSLSRWWLTQGRAEEAASRLKAICDWFSEGHDAPDLRSARDVLTCLGIN
jgi:tetratricopeptide (TPR) repeat protein